MFSAFELVGTVAEGRFRNCYLDIRTADNVLSVLLSVIAAVFVFFSAPLGTGGHSCSAMLHICLGICVPNEEAHEAQCLGPEAGRMMT